MPEFIRGLSPDELATFRGVERQTIKLKSVVDRLFFLNECEVFGVVPKCVRLKRTFTITGWFSSKKPKHVFQCVMTSIGYKKGLGEIILVSLYFQIINEKNVLEWIFQIASNFFTKYKKHGKNVFSRTCYFKN